MKRPKGFTLVEILVTMAIIALLSALAIPQFMRFRLKSARTEAVLIISGYVKTQTSHYASNDHYYTPPCDPTWLSCFGSTEFGPDAVIREINEFIGIGPLDYSNMGYWFRYTATNPDYNGGFPNDPGFYAMLGWDMDDDFFVDLVGYQENLFLQVPGPNTPYPSKRILILTDDILNISPDYATPTPAP